MFRGGSTNMNGIMSGIEDRTNYNIGSPGQKQEIGLGQPVSARERLEGVADKFSSSGMDPLNQFLIQGGLNLMSQPSTGGLLSDIATAAKDPATNLFAGLSERDKLKRDIALSGEQLDIESDINKEKVAADQKFLSDMDERDKKFQSDMKQGDRLFTKEMKGLDFDNNMKLITDQRKYDKLSLEDQRAYDERITADAREYEQMNIEQKQKYEERLIVDGRAFELEKIKKKLEGDKDLTQMEIDARAEIRKGDNYDKRKAGFIEKYDSDVQAGHRTDFELNGLEAEANKKFGQNFSGFTGGEYHGPFTDEIKSKNVGKTFYDVTDGQFKQVTRSKGSDGELGYKVIDINTYTPDASETETGGNDYNTDNPSYKYPPKNPDLSGNPPFGTNIEDQG
jgi:hypothetical protein